ncbi:uncharacterized protein METZ01_LOCUS362109 [marine metagenome]|uniref:DUF420 domain-containing protein n=1 Tax=marine metagenome TaxID=408172 RepID=A0A382SIF2_9ZZZZ
MNKNDNSKDSFWLKIIYILSIIIILSVAFLILGPRPAVMEGVLDVSRLPLINALLNSVSTVLLIIALWLIKKRKFLLIK